MSFAWHSLCVSTALSVLASSHRSVLLWQPLNVVLRTGVKEMCI